MVDLSVNEWTQREYLINKRILESQGVKVVLVDTILQPIEGVETVLYDPPALRELPKGSVFVFYCDSGKGTLNRLPAFRVRLPGYVCINLIGGRGYWRTNLSI